LAYLCCLHPDSGIDTKQIGEIIQTDMGRVHPNALAMINGIHAFRSGDYEAAMRHLRPSGDDVQFPAILFFCAMAAHRMGQANEAQEFLEKAIEEYETRIPGPDGPPVAAYLPDRWACWGQLQILKRQAEEMINAPREGK
jgi:hypothetical protein